MIKILSYRAEKPYYQLIEKRIKEQNWTVVTCSKIDQVLEVMFSQVFDLILLNTETPHEEILEILQTIQTENIAVLSLVLTTDKAKNINQLLAAGATEVLMGQVNWPELWLRLKILVKLQKRDERQVEEITIGRHFYQEGILIQAGQQIKLRQKENRILECLTKYQHKVLNRNELMKYVWNCPADYPSPDTIDVYIRRLRIKLGINGRAIKTYRGFGYRWEPEV